MAMPRVNAGPATASISCCFLKYAYIHAHEHEFHACVKLGQDQCKCLSFYRPYAWPGLHQTDATIPYRWLLDDSWRDQTQAFCQGWKMGFIIML